MKSALVRKSLRLLKILALFLAVLFALSLRLIWLTYASRLSIETQLSFLPFINVTENTPVTVCTRPITINRRYGNKTVAFTVPCGKCAECRSVRQSAFAAETLLEAADCDSMAFATLTYRDELLPWTLVDSEYSAFLFGLPYSKDKPLGVIESDVLGASGLFAPTLHREHLKAHLKRFRKWLGPDRSKVFRYAFFGEFGSRRNRPHYHGLLFNLSPAELDKFKELWSDYYGLTHIVVVPRFNQDGSNAYLKVSKYVSKYIAKGSALPDFCKYASVEKPRLMRSVGYGLKNLDIERMRNFTLPRTVLALGKN